MQDISRQILSDITIYNKYSRYLPEQERRESWDEIVERNKDMHKKKYPYLSAEIDDVFDSYVKTKKVLPSMRSLQFAGKPIAVNPARIYNCAYAAVDNWQVFGEAMFLLLGGTGFGYSVQFHHVEKLPPIIKPTRNRRYLISDSIEGWAQAVEVLMKAYFFGKPKPQFDFSDIRPKGSKLITAGGKAPGPDPLKECLFKVEQVLNRKENGEQLTSIEVHEIMCLIADAVLAGGIRRAAMIALFSFDDEDMLTAKFGNWWETHPEFARANNSAVILRNRIQESEFKELWEKIEASNSGEPGFFLTEDIEWGMNPCAEISLRDAQFCNLTTINASDISSQEDFNSRATAAAFIGTLQAGYTDFHFLRDKWKRTTEKEALLGVSMTGIASQAIFKYNISEAAKKVKNENIRVSKLIGTKPAARLTAIKPEGTTSLVLGSSSGVHAWHSKYYIRRMRIGKNEPIYTYLIQNHPDIVEDDFFKPNIEAVVSIPQKAPADAVVLDNETALDTLERVKQLHNEWIKPGHVKGQNTNNVSATISIKENEWGTVGEWLWKNRHSYTALSFLPYDGHTYKQAPFESIDEKTYNEMFEHLQSVDLTKIVEKEDLVQPQAEIACGGNACEI